MTTVTIGSGQNLEWSDGVLTHVYEDSTTNRLILFSTNINITYSGPTLTNYQIKVIIDTATPIAAGRMRADGGDIRFRDSDGSTDLPYWVESGMDSASTIFWVKVPSISTNKTIIMHYCNSSNTYDNTAGATNTFINWGFTGSTEVDPGSKLTVGTNDINITAETAGASNVYVALPTIADFAYDCEFNTGTVSNNGGTHILIGSTNTNPTWNTWGSNNGLGFVIINNAGNQYIMLEKYVSGTRTSTGVIYVTNSTTYYITLKRISTTLTLSVYTDAARTIHQSGSPVQLTGVATTSFTYLNVADNDITYSGTRTRSISNTRLRVGASSDPSASAEAWVDANSGTHSIILDLGPGGLPSTLAWSSIEDTQVGASKVEINTVQYANPKTISIRGSVTVPSGIPAGTYTDSEGLTLPYWLTWGTTTPSSYEEVANGGTVISATYRFVEIRETLRDNF